MKPIGRRSIAAVAALALAGIVSEASADCVSNVSVEPGRIAEIGRVDGKVFIVDTQPAKGTLLTTKEGASSVLQYRANNVATPTSDIAVCEIQGMPRANVTVSIQSAASGTDLYSEVAKTLVLLFALAVILESALAALFRWRPFVEILNPRAVRPLVAVILAWTFVRYFDLDIVTALVNAAKPDNPKPINIPGQLLTALVLAGGSSGINSLLVGLGFRQVSTPENTQPRPPPDKAWIAVKARRKAGTTGDIQVLIGADRQVGATAEPALAGIIKGSSQGGLLSYFTRDLGRFPNYGGYEVKAGTELRVLLRAGTQSGQTVEAVWGPHVPAPGAILDLDMEI
ncbi:hypothetical protein [Kaistia granuli]|uniref:hypothetical protein n=1 Tax=Kaistia granuli TaxID=363259 RepID=UPI00037D513A|nr:hypothetical protein [Kaistia granuli]